MAKAAASVRRTQGVLGGRSDAVVRRVLDAAIAELASSGYAGFRIDEVASRAAVNKTTIYRRWPTRLALVTALVERMRSPLTDNPLPDTGSIERDLVEAFTRRSAARRGVQGQAWARLLDERRNPEVEAMVGPTIDGRRDQWRSMVSRAIARSELPRDTDPQLVLHLVRAIVQDRGAARRSDRAWLVLAVRTVIAGARAGVLTRAVPAGS